MARNQTVVAAYNKSHYIAFNFTTSDSVSVDVITAANMDSTYGAHRIREIGIKATLADGYLGLGIAATVPAANSAVENLVPVFKDAYLTLEGTNIKSLTVRRAAATDVKVEGYVVVR